MRGFRVALRRAVVLLGVVAAATVATSGVGVSAAAAGSPCGHVRRAPSWRHIVVIAFENHSYGQILGSSAPPSYFKTLAAECGSATDYQAVHFPRSLPNYLAATGGRTVTTSDCLPGPACSSGGGNIFSQVGGRRWRTFAESMPTPCDATDTSLYVPRHVPAVYYTRIPHRVCVRDVVPMPAHPLRLRRSFTWIAPNLQHDMHDGTPAQASAWLQSLLGGSHGLLHRHPYVDGRHRDLHLVRHGQRYGHRDDADPLHRHLAVNPGRTRWQGVRPLQRAARLGVDAAPPVPPGRLPLGRPAPRIPPLSSMRQRVTRWRLPASRRAWSLPGR